MISPGTDHKNIPREFFSNLKFRDDLLAYCASDRQAQIGIWNICRQDILFWINAFVWQYNPLKKAGKNVGPFITWDFQERALLDSPETTGRKGIIWCYEHDRSAVVEKSRDMGASWLFLIFQDWMALFHEHFEALNISRNAESVDSNSRKSLFQKLRFIHTHLPQWMVDEGDQGITEQKMFFHFPKTSSEITGEASTGRAGVGGRAGVVFIDEFSKIKEDTQVREGTASTAESRFFNGTHEGVGTEFFRITQEPEFVKIRFHWTQHPAKNAGLYSFDIDTNKLHYWKYDPEKGKIVKLSSPEYDYPADFVFDTTGCPTGGPHPGIRSPWYDHKCKEIGSPRGIAMELDIDPLGAATQFFEPIMVKTLQATCRPPDWEGELEYDRVTAAPSKFQESKGGKIKLWFIPDGFGKPPKDNYYFGADCSEGAGNTPSCISGVNSLGQKVFEYADPWIDLPTMAVFLVALARIFADRDGNPALLCWEAAGPGLTVGDKIVSELRFSNIYYRVDDFRDPRKGLKARQAADKPGWWPTPNSKSHLLKTYKFALKDRKFVNRSHHALEQCLLFEYDLRGNIQHGSEHLTNDPSGARLNHADMVIADALACKMLLENHEAVEVKEAPEMQVNTLAWRHKRYDDEKRAAHWQD